VDVQTGASRFLVREPEETTAWHPHWSPDGKTIAFTKIEECYGRTCSGPVHVVIVDVETGERRRIARAYVLGWSPDGRFVLVQRTFGLYALDPVDGALTQIFEMPNTFGELWSGASWQPSCTHPGTRRADVLAGADGDDLICALEGDDRISAGAASIVSSAEMGTTSSTRATTDSMSWAAAEVEMLYARMWATASVSTANGSFVLGRKEAVDP
jgi:hypothetical protein